MLFTTSVRPFVLLTLLCSAFAAQHGHPAGHWIAAWTAMPQLTEVTNLPPAPFNTNVTVFPNSTIRQTIHVTVSASHFRLRISNAFGTTSLPITAATVARPTNNTAGVPTIDTTTLKTLTFSGQTSYTIPDGAMVVSDPFDFDIKAQTELSITLFLSAGQAGQSITSHPGSRTTTWMSFGNKVTASDIRDSSTQSVAHWYFISTLDAWLPTSQSTFIVLGDSITDGHGSTDNMNDRWPDRLLARLQSSGDPTLTNIAIGNQAAGGNCVVADCLGPNTLSRVDRDVLAQPGVRYAMIFEGVNDIGSADTSNATQQAVGDTLIAAFKQIIVRTHASGIPIFGATITPFCGSSTQAYCQPSREVERQRVNTWIRTSGAFDAVVDFDAAVRDPTAPDQLKPEYNFGDFLHLNPAGYQAMAQAFPVGVFRQFANGVDGWA